MEIEGKIIQILPLQTGSSARGEWQKQDFILETQDQYPKKVCISVWGNKIEVEPLLNTMVKASINIESREYNGKWYTDVKAWKIDSMAGNAGDSAPPPPHPDEVENFSNGGDEEIDDLPF